MSSLVRIESSRANGIKSRGPVTEEGKRIALANSANSTGPVTPEGKAASSRNSLRHGLLSDSIVLPNESPQRFEDLLATLQAELQPEPGIEAGFVEKMAVAYWRQMRLWCLEKLQFVHETRKQEALNEGEDSAMCTALAFRALCDESRALELLNRYESRFDRQYQRSLANFNAHREKKRQADSGVNASALPPGFGSASSPAATQNLPNEVNLNLASGSGQADSGANASALQPDFGSVSSPAKTQNLPNEVNPRSPLGVLAPVSPLGAVAPMSPLGAVAPMSPSGAVAPESPSGVLPPTSKSPTPEIAQ